MVRHIVIRCKDRTEYEKLIEILKEARCQWADGESLTLSEYDPYVDSAEAGSIIDSINIYVDPENKRVSYSTGDAPDIALSLNKFIKALTGALHQDPDVTMVMCRNRYEFDYLINIVHAEGYRVSIFNYYDMHHLDDNTKVVVGLHHYSKLITYWPEPDSGYISLEEFLVGKYLTAEPYTDPAGFTKQDLEDGMVVQTVSGAYYMYIARFSKFIRDDGFRFLSSYKDDLTDRTGIIHLNIKSVYRLNDLTSFDLADADMELIWSRPEEIVMTLSEVKKRLGIGNLRIVPD